MLNYLNPMNLVRHIDEKLQGHYHLKIERMKQKKKAKVDLHTVLNKIHYELIQNDMINTEERVVWDAHLDSIGLVKKHPEK